MQRMFYCRLFFLLILVLRLKCVFAQELNIGITASPIISMPLMDKNSTRSPTARAQRLNWNAKAGLNINARIKNMCIETGAHISSRTVAFRMDIDNLSYNNLNGSSSVSAKSKMTATGYSYSVPLLLGYKLHDHKAQTVYNIFGLLGAAYDNYTGTGFNHVGSSSSVGSGSGSIGSVTNVTSVAPADAGTKSWLNIVAGFKVNAILKKVGLIEYGLQYHYPLENAGKFHVNTIVSNGIYGSVFGGDFYPKLSYFDFHLTYYFLNFERGMGVKKYKNY